MLRLVEFWLKEAVCDSQRSIGHEQHSELELGDKFTWKGQSKVTLKSHLVQSVSFNMAEPDVGATVLPIKLVKMQDENCSVSSR